MKQLKKETTATDLQKVVFSYCKNKKLDYYDFVPYLYGAYSFQLTKDIEYLTNTGYIDGSLALKDIDTDIVIDSSAIEELRGKALVRKTYKAYPYYAINSEIAGEILDAADLNNIIQVKEQLIKNEQKLFSIGYEGKGIESFINKLLQNNVRLLCDVRRNPLSRKYGFSQSFLKNNLEKAGIKYVHIPALGIESDKRQTLETQNDYNNLFLEYGNSLSSKEPYLQEVLDLIKSNTRIAIMCYESDPKCCHRTIVKNYLEDKYNINCEDL